TRIVASVQREGRWRLAVVPADGGPARELGPADSTSRYAADWTPDGRALVATSEAGGIPHLVRVDTATGAEQPLTRTTGAHAGVEVGPDGAAWFLALHARGLDVRAARADSLVTPVRLVLDSLAPAVPPPTTARDTFALASLPPSRPYGLGPRWWRVLPGASASPEGVLGTLMVANVDPASRLSLVLQGGGGATAAWRGAAVAAAWRGWLPTLTGEAFVTRQRPSALRDGPLAPDALDAEYAGGHLVADVSRAYARAAWHAALGISSGTLDGGGLAERGTRTLGYGEVGARVRLSRDRDAMSASLLARGTAGRTGGEGWARIVTTASIGARMRGATLAVRGEYGEVETDAPAYERLVVGGGAPPFFDRRLLDQRLHMPALPPGTLDGARAATLRVSTTLFRAVEPYYWIGSGGGAEGELDRWHRVIGAEYAARFPTIGFVRLPGVDARVGAGYSLDEPYRDRLRAYVSVVYRP
ncbi:MAG TPA: hypothetical protein VFY16_13775, partial [Gemmatimonadaceae bacterium]|nr:hypothetical protein [Gemmatimonadaceae bacterium]